MVANGTGFLVFVDDVTAEKSKIKSEICSDSHTSSQCGWPIL